ncbi:MAG TPA: YicC/YloC family endoribonuclease [Gemmatimonadaceae bacterium]|nr:YicC/YloC family endoribonuclease [Gemmatimonadaceae bacterium]
MTGFGTAEGLLGQAKVAVDARSVNHRFFNLTLRLPSELSRWEAEVREIVRRHVSRGHVTVAIRLERDSLGAVVVDEQRFASYVELLRRLRERYRLAGEVDLATVLALPDVFTSAAFGDEVQQGLVRLVESALRAMNRSRESEGRALASAIAEHVAKVEAALERIEKRAPERLVEQRDRLREHVRQLASGVAIDEQRLALEIALLAERLDVTEEATRLRTHVAAFRQVLDAERGEPVGKRLGFLLQEMLRETNTLGAKACDASITGEVISIKEEIERIREQVENLE